MTQRQLVSSGAMWEPVVGYSRAVRVGSWVSVAGTTAAAEGGGAVGGDDIGAQARRRCAASWLLCNKPGQDPSTSFAGSSDHIRDELQPPTDDPSVMSQPAAAASGASFVVTPRWRPSGLRQTLQLAISRCPSRW
jgi:hypothetical protein